MEVGKFMITGIIGFVGIGLKEKVISFYQRKANKAQIPINKCESLDFVEATHRHKVYPLMYCYMELDRNLDIDQLQTAVIRSCQYEMCIRDRFLCVQTCQGDYGTNQQHLWSGHQ